MQTKNVAQISDEAADICALQHFVIRLYLFDCSRSADPLKRLEDHQAYAKALEETYMKGAFKQTNDDIIMNATSIAASISQLMTEISDVVRDNVKPAT